jgi:lipid-binding SYLF domain-containing protein
MRTASFLLIAILAPLSAFSQASVGGWDPNEVEKARAAADSFRADQPQLEAYFESAYAWAIYPAVTKVAWIVGGAHGSGIAFRDGEAVGRTTLTQGSIGFQFGGEAFSEILFFQNEKAFQRFTSGKLEFGAKASATLITEGASADLAYERGVAVFTRSKGGLMVDASLSGQKFSYEPGVGSGESEEE